MRDAIIDHGSMLDWSKEQASFYGAMEARYFEQYDNGSVMIVLLDSEHGR